MNAFERFVYALQAGMEEPPLYGWFHLLSLALLAVGTYLLCRFLKDAGWRRVRLFLTVALVAMALAELYKQTVFSLTVTGGVASWNYEWYSFPYQFCSTPLYVLPFAILSREGRLRDATLSFLSSFSLFGGLVVMIYPGDVYVETVGINLQTMLHHGLQVAIGIFLCVWLRRRISRRYFLSGVVVFLIAAAVAVALNIGVHHALLAAGNNETFNMFFISPYHDCTLPLLSLIAPHLPYPLFLVLYLLGFSVAAALMHGAAYGIITLIKQHREGHLHAAQ